MSYQGRNYQKRAPLSFWRGAGPVPRFAGGEVIIEMKSFLIYLVILTVSSCETEKIIFNGPYHVRFTDIALTEKESNSKVIKIEVHNAGPALTEDVAISYTISGDAREGIDYEIVGTREKVSIQEGEYFGYIEVQLINNANNILRSQDIIFTLTRVNSTKLEVGQGEGGIGKKFTLSILDDCILGGIYSGTSGAFSAPTGNIAITSSDCENYRISNWDVGIFNAADPVPLNFIDNGDNSLTVRRQTVELFFGFFSVDIDVEGVGSVNPVTREIFLSLTFEDSVNTYSVTITLKPE